MSIRENINVIRKRLGIKKLKDKIPMSDFEKAVILGLRESERHRIVHKAKAHA